MAINVGTLQILVEAKDTATATLQGMSGKLKTVGSKIAGIAKVAAVAGAAIGVGLGLVAKSFVDVASDAEQMQSRFNIVFKGMEDEMNTWAEEFGESAGRVKHEIKGYAAELGDVLKPMGLQTDEAAKMSKEMVELSLDLASFNDKQDADVIHAVKAALTGEREALKSLGIVISESDVKIEAYRAGLVESTVSEVDLEKATVNLDKALIKQLNVLEKNGEQSIEYRDATSKVNIAKEKLADTMMGETGELTKAAKVQSTMNLLYANSTDAQGNLNETSHEYANKVKAMRTQIIELKKSLGDKLLPVFSSIVGKITELTTRFGKWAEKTKLMEKVVGIVYKVKDAFDTAKTKIEEFIAKINFDTLIEIFNNLKDIGKIVLETFGELFDSFKEGSKEIDIAEIINKVLESIKKLTEFLKENPAIVKFVAILITAGGILAAIVIAISALTPIITGLIAVVTLLLNPVTWIIAALGLLYIAWTDNWFGIQEKTESVIAKIKNTIEELSGLKDKAIEWGKNLVQGFIDGITEKISALKEKMTALGNTVKDYLKLKSPADKGPLSELDKWGEAFVPTYMKGVEKGATNMGNNISNTTSKSVINNFNVSAPISYSGGGGVGMGEANNMANYIEGRVITKLKRKVS